MLTSESSTIIQTEEDKACLIEDSGKISCSDIQGDIKNLVELKYDYKGNYALLTDQGNLYRWGKLAKAQGELVSQNVETIIANDSAFAFLKLDGTVGAWGSRTQGGEFIYDYYSFEQTYFKASKKCVPVKKMMNQTMTQAIYMILTMNRLMIQYVAEVMSKCLFLRIIHQKKNTLSIN